MPATVDLVERSGDLKRDLLALARGPRFGRALQRALAERFGRGVVADEGELFNFLDHFILQRRQPDGRTVLEHFVEEHPELPEAERAMLLGWREVLEGIFEVQGHDEVALIVENLIDELPYRVRSNMGPAVFAQMPVGSYMIGRLVPVADEWLISGATSVLAASRRAEAYSTAANIAARMPSLVFRNPAKVEQGWELQREERRQFIDFFGADSSAPTWSCSPAALCPSGCGPSSTFAPSPPATMRDGPWPTASENATVPCRRPSTTASMTNSSTRNPWA